MAFVKSVQNVGKRVAVAFLAVLVFAFAIFSFLQGLLLFSIVLHLVGFVLTVYIANESAPGDGF